MGTREILQLYEKGKSYVEIANEFNRIYKIGFKESYEFVQGIVNFNIAGRR